MRTVSGDVLIQALKHGVSKLSPTTGQFPQASGMTMSAKAADMREAR